MNQDQQTPHTAAPDPAHPLPDAAQEAFCMFAACGTNRGLAYEQAQGRRMKKVTRESQASRWSKRPEIAARIRFLQIERAKSAQTTQTTATPPAPATETQAPRKPLPMPPPPPDHPGAGDVIDRDELARKLTRVIRAPEASTPELVQAAGALLKVLPELGVAQDDRRLSPDELVRYISTWAAAPLPLDAVLVRLLRLYPLADIRRELASITRRARRTAPAAPPAGEGAPPLAPT